MPPRRSPLAGDHRRQAGSYNSHPKAARQVPVKPLLERGFEGAELGEALKAYKDQ